MAFGERKKLGDKLRTAFTADVLSYIETAKQLGQDPLSLARLSTTGSIVLGAELGAKLGKRITPKDSVYWVAVNPNTGKIGGRARLAPDLGKWRKKLVRQLKAWGAKSEVKKLAKKRAVTGAVVAAVTTGVVIAVVLTAGAAAGPAAAAAATQGGAGAAAGGTAAAGTAGGGAGLTGLMQGLQAISAAQSAGKGLSSQAAAAESAMPPEQTALVKQEAESIVNPPIYEQPLFWVGILGVVVVGAGAVYVATRD